MHTEDGEYPPAQRRGRCSECDNALELPTTRAARRVILVHDVAAGRLRQLQSQCHNAMRRRPIGSISDATSCACADINARFAAESILSKRQYVGPEAKLLEMLSGELLEKRAKWREAEDKDESDPAERSKDDEDWLRRKRARAAREFKELDHFYAMRFAGMSELLLVVPNVQLERCCFLSMLACYLHVSVFRRTLPDSHSRQDRRARVGSQCQTTVFRRTLPDSHSGQDDCATVGDHRARACTLPYTPVTCEREA
jgi:hypothetical protein